MHYLRLIEEYLMVCQIERLQMMIWKCMFTHRRLDQGLRFHAVHVVDFSGKFNWRSQRLCWALYEKHKRSSYRIMASTSPCSKPDHGFLVFTASALSTCGSIASIPSDDIVSEVSKYAFKHAGTGQWVSHKVGSRYSGLPMGVLLYYYDFCKYLILSTAQVVVMY